LRGRKHTPLYDVGLQTAYRDIFELVDKQSSVPLQQLLLASESLVAEGMTDHLPLSSVRRIVRPEDTRWIAMDIRSVEYLRLLKA
jgi:4-hydroxy-L-threonine phosphate dehydrogenase PdxA